MQPPTFKEAYERIAELAVAGENDNLRDAAFDLAQAAVLEAMDTNYADVLHRIEMVREGKGDDLAGASASTGEDHG